MIYLFLFIALSIFIISSHGLIASYGDTDFAMSHSIVNKNTKYVIPYDIENAVIDSMVLKCESGPSLVLHMSSSDVGVLEMNLPPGMIGGIHEVDVDGVEWDDVSIDENTITIKFPKNIEQIHVFGSYHLGPNDGVCDVVHNPPFSYILPPMQQLKFGVTPIHIVCKDTLELIFKFSDDSPACVLPDTKQELIVRGWTKQ